MIQLPCLHCSAGGATKACYRCSVLALRTIVCSPPVARFSLLFYNLIGHPRPRGSAPEVAPGHTAACSPPPYLTSLNLALKEGILRTGTGVKAWS